MLPRDGQQFRLLSDISGAGLVREFQSRECWMSNTVQVQLRGVATASMS